MDDDEFELIWMAGFFDGEGSIGMPCRGVNKIRNLTLQVMQVSYNGRVPVTLEPFVRLGGHCTSTDNRRFNWYCNGWEAANILERLLPYLKGKRPQAVVALRAKDTMAVSGHGGGRGKPLSDATRALRGEVALELTRLKKVSS